MGNTKNMSRDGSTTSKKRSAEPERASFMETAIPWGGFAARLIIGGVWIVAGALKLSDLRESVRAVQVYEILPSSLAEITGIVLPLVEIGIGLLLVIGLATAPAAIISGLLLVAFIIGISSAWARGLQIDCGCFGGGGQLGEGEQPKYLQEILRDIALLLGCALLVWRSNTPFSADRLIFKTK